MAPKRKSDAAENGHDGETSPKAAKKATGKTADKLGLNMKTFEKNAPELVCAITPKDGKEELVKFDCQKMKMQTGSFGYSGANKRINLEIEIDGEKQLVQAQVTLNITIMGSKKVEEGEASTSKEAA